MADKFHPGDLVTVDGKSLAIIKGTYAQLHGGSDEHSRSSYAVYRKDRGPLAWFDEAEIILVERNEAWYRYEKMTGVAG